MSAASITPPLYLIPMTPVPVTMGLCVRVEGSTTALEATFDDQPPLGGNMSPEGRRGS